MYILTHFLLQELPSWARQDLEDADPMIVPRRQKNKNGPQSIDNFNVTQLPPADRGDDNSVHCDRRHDDPRNDALPTHTTATKPAIPKRKRRTKAEIEQDKRDAEIAAQQAKTEQLLKDQAVTFERLLRSIQASQTAPPSHQPTLTQWQGTPPFHQPAPLQWQGAPQPSPAPLQWQGTPQPSPAPSQWQGAPQPLRHVWLPSLGSIVQGQQEGQPYRVQPP